MFGFKDIDLFVFTVCFHAVVESKHEPQHEKTNNVDFDQV